MKSKTKIFVFGTRGFPNIQGGVEKHCEKLYPLLSGSNYEIKVFRRKPYVKIFNSHFKGIVFKDLWTLKTKNFETPIHSFFSTIYCILEGPDIVHIHNIGSALFLPFLKIAGIKTVVTYHSQNYQHEKWNYFARSILKIGEILTSQMADKIIIVSRYFINNLPHRRTIYIPNGVDNKVLSKESNFLKMMGVKPNNYILTVSRFSPEKGLDIIIKAFKKINDKDIKLVIVGDSDQITNYSKRLKKTIGTDDRIIATGFITGKNLSQIYYHALLFVLPSFHEGLSISALEAMSYGLPVLLSNIPANKELALPGELFPAGDVKALTKMIEKHLAKPANTTKNWLYEERQRRLSAEFSWSRIAHQTEAVYENLLLQ